MARVEAAPEVIAHTLVGGIIVVVGMLLYKVGKIFYDFEIRHAPRMALDPSVVVGLSALAVVAMALVTFAYAYKVIRRG